MIRSKREARRKEREVSPRSKSDAQFRRGLKKAVARDKEILEALD